MNRFVHSFTLLSGLIAVPAFLGGCSKSDQAAKTMPAELDHDHEAGHEHGDEHEHGHGPHEGEIIELGSADHHAELVHDEASGVVSIYILDDSAEKTVAIAATDVLINATVDGAGAQFKLAAAPAADDPAGKSSAFTSKDAKLVAALNADGTKPQLVVTIDGKQHRGDLAHEHHEH